MNNTPNSIFRKSYAAKSVIAKDQASVWHVLTDLKNYHEWNPFTPAVDTDWEMGSKVKLTVAMKPNSKPLAQTEYISSFEPPHQISWGIKWGPFLKANRIQRLTKAGDKTEYFTEDIIEGPLTPIVHLLYGKHIQRGFDAVAKSLKSYLKANQ